MTSLALPRTLALPPLPSATDEPKSTNTNIPKNGEASTSAVGAAATGTGTGTGGGRQRSRSPTPEEEDEDSEDEKKKSAGGGGKKKKAGGGEKGEYKYTSEISQMMFVFGEVQDPLPETVRLVEDIVRGQIIEIVTRARLLTHLRSSRFLSAEDLIFLIRDDRGKVNRLRTYLSWKDVRKRAKEEEERGGDVELEVDGVDEKSANKGRKSMVKLPWELLTPFSDFLRTIPSKQNRDDEEEEDEDEMQAHQDSMQRLRDADEITKKMTKDEYVHYSDCRQASFTYRKSRRFRDFINFSAYLDVRPNDDIIDILGFLSFEMVRSLCVTALDLRERVERSKALSQSHGLQSARTSNGATGTSTSTGTGNSNGNGAEAATSSSPTNRKSIEVSPKNKLVDLDPPSITNTNGNTKPPQTQTQQSQPLSLFAPPPSAREPLSPTHILEAFAQIQRDQAASRVRGMRNFRGGMGKARVALV